MNSERSSRPRTCRVGARIALLAGLPILYSCSLLVEHGTLQCTTDADCGQGYRCQDSICLGAGGGGGNSASSSSGSGGSSSSSSSASSSGTGDPCAVDEALKPIVDLTGDVTADFVLGCENVYLLKGETIVTAGATLTIAAGTTIKGFYDAGTPAVLVVQPGGKLIAVGTADKPIVFTSELPANQRKAGDWGGVILLGNAPVNWKDAGNMPAQGKIEGVKSGGLYGGDDPNDSSGSLKYVRIEYSGVAIAPNNEINGLTFGGVGRGTVVDYVQVRHTADDCFEFFGGTVNAKHLACQYNGDDGFDWDNGYQGKLQFLVLQQDPAVADDTNGLEGDNDATGSANQPVSEPTIFNATLCGKNVEVNKEQYGMLLRKSTKAHVANAIFMGFEAGLDVRNSGAGIDIRSSIFFGNLIANQAYAEVAGGTGVFADDDASFDEVVFLSDPQWKNATSDPGIAGCFDANAPSFGPTVSLAANAATPTNDGFLDTTATFIGAFRDSSDTWATTGKWAVWSDK